MILALIALLFVLLSLLIFIIINYFLVPILLVMEFCSKGNLKDILTKSRINTDDDNDYKNIYSKLNERQLITFAAEIAKGMNFLFGKKVENVFIINYACL